MTRCISHRLIISDDHAGLRVARQAIFGGVPWQRCQFHLQQNARDYVPRRKLEHQVTQDLRIVFQAPDRLTAQSYVKQLVHKYTPTTHRLADWLETNIPQGLTILGFPSAHRRLLRTVNGLERLQH